MILLMLFHLLQCGEKGHYANMVSQLINLPGKENKTNINLQRFSDWLSINKNQLEFGLIL